MSLYPTSPINLSAPPIVTALSKAVHGTHVDEETFYLADRWALHFYEYRGVLKVEEHTVNLQPGTITLVPPAKKVTFYYEGVSTHLYTHFRQPSTPAEAIKLPLFWNPQPETTALKALLYDAISFRSTNPLRANVRVLDILLALVQIPPINISAQDDVNVLQNALTICEIELNQKISVQDLAKRCGVPQARLTALFKKQFGQSVVQWLRTRRIEKAAELLKYSDVPIKAIAFEVGIPDLQYFNKTVHRELGLSPREYRAQNHKGRPQPKVKG